jgi:hypothetical protein
VAKKELVTAPRRAIDEDCKAIQFCERWVADIAALCAPRGWRRSAAWQPSKFFRRTPGPAVFLNGATEIFRAGVVVRRQNRKISIVVIAHVRTIQTNHGGGRACSPVLYSDTASTGSADQLEHRSHSGCPRDPVQSRNYLAENQNLIVNFKEYDFY